MYWQTDAVSNKFVSLVDSLKPNILRWPGGTLAQFYHWDKPGYGFIFEEIKNIHPAYAQSLKNQKAYVDDKINSRRYIDDFIELTLQTHASVLVCANLVTATDDETIQLLNFLTSKHIKIAGVELGNEIYLPKMRVAFDNDVKKYLKRAEQLSIKIKKLYPHLDVAVCAAPIRDLADENPPQGSEAAFFKEWNLELAKYNFYDAVVLHYYFPIPCSGSIDADFNCALQEINNCTSHILPESLNQYEKIFGAEKKIWITEWNIATKNTNGRFGNTMLQSFFIDQFYHTINSYNASHNNRIQIATYQTLAGDIYGTCMIMDKSLKETFTDTAANPYIRKTSYFNHLLLRNLYKNDFMVCTVQSNRKNLPLHAYYSKSMGSLFLYFIQDDEDAINIKELSINGKNFSLENNAKLYAIQSEQLWDGFGLNKADGKLQNRKTPQYIEKTESLKNITISKYSYGYLQLKL
jgi:hypothetical protein